MEDSIAKTEEKEKKTKMEMERREKREGERKGRKEGEKNPPMFGIKANLHSEPWRKLKFSKSFL